MSTTETAPTFTTNLWETGTSSPRRVKITVNGAGALVWCELFDCCGDWLGAGPTIRFLPAALLEAAEERIGFPPTTEPLMWKAA